MSKILKKVKLKLNRYLYLNSGDAINKIEKFVLSKPIALLSVDFESYCKKSVKPNLSRLSRQYLYQAIGWLTFLRFSFAAFVSDPKIMVIIGDAFYLTENKIPFNLLVAFIALNSSLFRALFFIGERKHELHFIYMFQAIKTGRDNYLNSESLKKFTRRTKFCELIVFKFTPIYASISFSLVITSYLLYAYLKNDYPFDAILCIIWALLISFSGYLMSSIQCVSYGLLYLSSYYLKLWFQQISRMKCNSIIEINKVMKEHKMATNLTQDYNRFFSKLMAINYFVATIACNLFAYIGFYGNGNIYLRAIVGSQTFFCFLLIYLSVYTSVNISNEAIHFYSPINSLIATKSLRMTVRQKWKIVNFLENLSEKVIGIYCYDLFPFTNHEFVKYVSGIVVVYFLIIQLVQNYGSIE